MKLIRKSRIFIGSSREAIPYARAVCEQLEMFMEVNPWYAGSFRANDYSMESLERELDGNDFGVFIFAAEDIALIRNELFFVTRDNTLFEMGLFWGRLGRNRVFCLIPTQKSLPEVTGAEPASFHLPSDLQGLTLLRYTDHERLAAAVDVSCGKILESVSKEGIFKQRHEIIAQSETLIQRKESVLQFFWEYIRNINTSDSTQRYSAYAEAIRNSILPPSGYRTLGAALWKRINDDLVQVGGNVGRGRSFHILANNEKKSDEEHIIVLRVYNTGEWTFFGRREIAAVHVLCYPLGTEHVLSVHFSGKIELTAEQLKGIVEENDDLLVTIQSLVGGDSK